MIPSTLNVQLQPAGSNVIVVLSGAMDENANYEPVKAGKWTSFTFDFAGISLINSTGLQQWTKFLSSLPNNAVIAFRNCSQRVVNQINLFPGFIGGHKVNIESFFAPYFCAECDQSQNVLLTTSQLPTPPKSPAQNCPTCSKAMEFDGIEKKFFAFLNRKGDGLSQAS